MSQVDPLFTVVLATTNAGKLAELRALFADLPLEFVSLAEVAPDAPAVVEDGETFEANAALKARAASAGTLLVAIADDSGLEVDALGGRPGVRSARFAGSAATDADNNAALLQALSEVEEAARGARFRCVLAVVDPYRPETEPVFVHGTCEGSIAREPRGSGGFGYDPLFIVEGGARTLSELSDAEKNAVSHRGHAVRALRPILEGLIADRRRTLDRLG